MKYLVSILIAFHGAIHILGFLKGFQLAEIQNLQAPVSKTSGLFWLLAFGLLCASAILFFFNKTIWMYLASAGMIVSTLLILNSWGDAKYGMIPNLIIKNSIG